jgi:hypothetical protein
MGQRGGRHADLAATRALQGLIAEVVNYEERA